MYWSFINNHSGEELEALPGIVIEKNTLIYVFPFLIQFVVLLSFVICTACQCAPIWLRPKVESAQPMVFTPPKKTCSKWRGGVARFRTSTSFITWLDQWQFVFCDNYKWKSELNTLVKRWDKVLRYLNSLIHSIYTFNQNEIVLF